MPKAQVTECHSRDSCSSGEEREHQAWQDELALVSCRGPIRAGNPKQVLNVTLATEAEYS